MKKLLLSAIIALLPLTSMADTILGIKIGAGSWEHDPSGNVTVSGSGGTGTSADLKNDLALKEDSEGYAYFSIEHPIPLIPNIKVMQTALTTAGSGTASVTFDFNGTTVAANAAVTTNLQLDQTDYILYYEVLDNIVSFDVGINAKYLDAKATVNNDTVSFSGYVPMLYAAAEIALPADLTIGVELSTLEIDDSEISDLIAKITYTSDYLFGVEAGIRSQTIKLTGFDGVNANMEFDGVFAGVFLKF